MINGGNLSEYELKDLLKNLNMTEDILYYLCEVGYYAYVVEYGELTSYISRYIFGLCDKDSYIPVYLASNPSLDRSMAVKLKTTTIGYKYYSDIQEALYKIHGNI